MKFKGKLSSKGDAKKAVEAIKKAFKDTSVLIGLPSDALPYPDGTSVVMVGAVHEFGSATRGIPERSFLRSSIQDNQKKYFKMAEKGVKRIVEGKMNIRKLAGLIGLEAENDVKDKIVTLDSPANTPATIKRKGSSNPLIDTGHLRQSIRFEVRGGGE